MKFKLTLWPHYCNLEFIIISSVFFIGIIEKNKYD